jgi:hypothetical protein
LYITATAMNMGRSLLTMALEKLALVLYHAAMISGRLSGPAKAQIG